MVQEVKSPGVVGSTDVASTGSKLPSTVVFSRGSSIVGPAISPASAHCAVPGFQPLVSAVRATVSFPPSLGVASGSSWLTCVVWLCPPPSPPPPSLPPAVSLELQAASTSPPLAATAVIASHGRDARPDPILVPLTSRGVATPVI